MGSIDKACISGFLCRLCSEMHRIVIHIYGDQGQRLCLVEKINGYLPITISPTDPLPKTICTTCLRRVEQHYDLLMHLSRVKERFLRLNNKQRPHVSLISSTENSEDEVYQSDDESGRRQQQRDIPPQRHSNSRLNSVSSPAISDAALFTSTVTVNTTGSLTNDNNEEFNDGTNDNRSGASTSASAMSTRYQHIHDTNITNSSSSSSIALLPHSTSTENGNSFGIVSNQHSG